MAINDKLKKALDKADCYKHPVGCVIHTLDNQYILGWNGPPIRGVGHSECLRKDYPSGEGMHLCPSVHAERRAISYAAALDGISLLNADLYMSEWFPCAECAKSIIEAGIVGIITPDELYLDKDKRILIPKLQGQSYNFEMSERLIREAGIEIIIDPSLK